MAISLATLETHLKDVFKRDDKNERPRREWRLCIMWHHKLLFAIFMNLELRVNWEYTLKALKGLEDWSIVSAENG